MDESILRDLFEQTAKASEILGIDEDFRTKILETRQKLAPFQIGKYGQLQEWLQDIDRETDSHRHQSHLYGLFPSAQITPEEPKLFDAAKKSLIGRGDLATGWSLAWKLNLWARCLDGNHAYLLLTHLLSEPEGDMTKSTTQAIDPLTGKKPKQPERRGGTYPNLFDAHPPFQIDGNFGATSGITEMLMQSHEGFIRLLPALPDVWPAGHISGIVARGGFVVEINWKDHFLESAKLISRIGNQCQIYSETPIAVVVTDGRSVSSRLVAKNVYAFDTSEGDTYTVNPSR